MDYLQNWTDHEGGETVFRSCPSDGKKDPQNTGGEPVFQDVSKVLLLSSECLPQSSNQLSSRHMASLYPNQIMVPTLLKGTWISMSLPSLSPAQAPAYK